MRSAADLDAIVRAADPAAAPTPEDDLDALHRQAAAISAIAPGPRRRRVRRRVLLAAPVAAALIAALAVALRHDAPSLATRAYAATDPGDGIVHEVARITLPGPSGLTVDKQSWWRPQDGTARSIETSDGHLMNESTVDARGVLHIRSLDGGNVLRPDDPGSRAWIDGVRSVTLGFRESYAGKRLHDDGMTTLGGRAVRAYSTDPQAEPVEPGDPAVTRVETFYLDPDTSMPVAERDEFRSAERELSYLAVVTAYESLPRTPANVAKLR